MPSSTMHRFKVAILGDSRVGKSALVQAVTNDSAANSHGKHYIPTIGCELGVKQIRIPNTSDSMELHIYDVSGNAAAYQSLYKSYLSGSGSSDASEAAKTGYADAATQALVLAYDVANRESFLRLQQWFALYQQSNGSASSSSIVCLVGLKSDLRQAGHATVKLEEIQALAQQLEAQSFECSVQESVDTDAVFNHVADALYRQHVNLQHNHDAGNASHAAGSAVIGADGHDSREHQQASETMVF